MPRLRRASERCCHRPGGSFKLVVDAVDEESAHDAVGGEARRAEANDEEDAGRDKNACAERQGLPRQPQAVADAAHGMDQPRLLEVDLFAQVADVVLDDPGIAAEVVAPDVVDDLGLGHHAPGVQE